MSRLSGCLPGRWPCKHCSLFRLSVITDERRMRASSEIANERKMAGREKERVYSFFLNSITASTSWKKVSFVKMSSNIKTSKGCRRVSHARHVRLCAITDFKCYSKQWLLTSHRVYQQLVYRNEVYRLHYSVSPQPPSRFRAPFLDPLFQLSWSLEQASLDDDKFHVFLLL